MPALTQFGEKSHTFIMTPIADDARINILSGAVRSSKTFSMIPKLIALVLTAPAQGLGIITGVSKDTIYDNVLRDLFDIIGPANYRYNRQTGDLVLFEDHPDVRNPYWKVIGAKDEGSEKFIRGKTVANAYCDELCLMPETFFKQLLNRMSVEGAKLYATTNPDHPLHWLYVEYMTDAAKLESGMVKVLHYNLEDNPSLSDEYIRFIKSAYKGVFYQRFIEGKWVIAEGAIYRDAFTEDLLFEDSDIPAGLMSGYVARYFGIDYGTTNPCVFLDVVDDGDVLWVLREYVWNSKQEARQKTDKEYGDDFLEFTKDIDDAFSVIDPSAASFAAELRTRGRFPKEADNEVLDGIRMVSSLMAQKKLRVHRRNCPSLIKELGTYAWDPKKELKGKEQPLKVADHGPDALRYIIKTYINPWRLGL